MYIYLHGFASGPNSIKARDLQARCDRINIDLHVPDLNQGNFSHLTISRQVAQVIDLLPVDGSEVTLIGASLGGLTAAIVARDYLQVNRLILLAPAFEFTTHWLPKLGAEKLKLWADTSYLPIYHHARQISLPLHYNFVIDARRYSVFTSDRILPTLIIHGIHDDVIPLAASRDFAARHPWVNLVELDSNHALIDASDRIWQEICQFCQI